VAVEGELEDSCPGHLKLVAQLTNVRRDESQVLRNERQSAEVSLDSAPGPGTHWPDRAFVDPAGMCQAAANPRK
jgi:hypothetical protein